MTDENENEPEWMSHDYNECDCFPCAVRYLEATKFGNNTLGWLKAIEMAQSECEHLDYAEDLDGGYCLNCGLREAEGDDE